MYSLLPSDPLSQMRIEFQFTLNYLRKCQANEIDSLFAAVESISRMTLIKFVDKFCVTDSQQATTDDLKASCTPLWIIDSYKSTPLIQSEQLQ